MDQDRHTNTHFGITYYGGIFWAPTAHNQILLHKTTPQQHRYATVHKTHNL